MHNHRFFFILLLLFALLYESSMPLTAAEPENLHAAAAVLRDAESGRVLVEKNGTEKLPMASTTKIMTANYAQTECQFRYCGTAIPFLTVRSTAR